MNGTLARDLKPIGHKGPHKSKESSDDQDFQNQATPRATLFAIALLTVVMLTFGAFSAEEAASVGVLAGEPEATAGECQPPMASPCPHAPSRGETTP